MSAAREQEPIFNLTRGELSQLMRSAAEEGARRPKGGKR